MEMLVLGLKGLEGLLVVVNGGLVLSLPLLDNALLHHHNLVGLLFRMLRSLFGLEQLVLSLRHLEIVLIGQLGHAVMVDALQSANLAKCCVLLIAKAVDKLPEPLVFFKEALIVADVRVQLYFLLVHQSLELG